MNQYSHCPIWNTSAFRESLFDRDVERINSPRAGGRYLITLEAITLLPQIDDRVKARLTSWLVDQRRLGVECPEILQQTITDAEQQRDLPVPERADRLLDYIKDQTGEIGTYFIFTSQEMNSTAAAAWSESVDSQEVRYLLDYLCRQGWIERPDSSRLNDYILTVEGYTRLEELEAANAESTEGFWGDDSSTKISTSQNQTRPEHMRDVFIIHGRDKGTRETVARFIEQLELNSIILDEQPNQGQTIIEKFEQHAKVEFAIALLTPDDTGGLSEDEQSLKPRARQNVIFELGYFTGKLGRSRVCALTKGHVDMPSDYYGVLYIPFDESGGWKMKLVQELRNAGFDVDANRVF